MGESFYSVLDIPMDAGPDVVERAYRERVKDHHPDVTDAPNAEQTFKQLTIARDTLVDETERARYDRLGHEEYVRRFTPRGLFDVESDASPATADDTAQATTASGPATVTDGGGAAWWADRTPDAERSGVETTATRANTAPVGIYASRPAGGSTTVPVGSSRPSPVTTLRRTLEALGPWVLVHLLLFASTIVTGWFLVSITAGSQLSILSVGALCLLATASLAASALHLVSTVYA